MFKDLWTAQEQSVEQDKEAIQRQINQLDRKTNQLVDRLVDTDSPTLVVAYESRVKEMEEQKLFLTEQLANTGKPVTPMPMRFDPLSIFWQTREIYGLPTAWKTRVQS